MFQRSCKAVALKQKYLFRTTTYLCNLRLFLFLFFLPKLGC